MKISSNQKQLLDMCGIITVLNTPFTQNDEVDVSSLKKNVKIAINAGVTGFLVPAMASEVDKLSIMEREAIVKTVLEVAKGKAKVIGGASAQSKEKRIEITRSLVQAGCDGVLANIPYENKTQFCSDVKDLAELNPPFLMLQDWDFRGYGIPVDLICDLFSNVDCFRAIKVEVIPAGVKYTEILKKTRGKLHVSGGWAVMQMIEAFDRGVHAIMPTGMHEIYCEIYSRYQKRKRTEAVELFDDLLPVLAFSNQHLDISIHFYKRLLHAQGIYSTPNVRDPILPFDAVHEKIANTHIDRVKNLIKTI